MLYQNLPFNNIFHVTAGFVLCAFLWTQGDRQALLSWWAAVALLSLFRLANYFFYRMKRDSYSVKFWNGLFGAGSILIGLLWGLAGALLTPHEILSYELFVGFVIAGMVVGAVPVLSSVKSVYLSFAFSAEIPYIIHVIGLEGEIYTAVSVIHILFLLLILLMTTRMNTLIRESLLLRFYNVDLVEKLQSSNDLLTEEVESHRKTESKLRENEQRLGALVDATFEGIILHKEGNIIEANRGISQMTGYMLEELIETPVVDLIIPDKRQELTAYIQSPNDKPLEADCYHKQGKFFPVEIRAGFVPYRGERVAFIVIRDITYYRELLKTQGLARQKAEEADQAKTEFLAAVSHELRTPLNAVLGFTQLMGDTELSSEQKEYLDMTYQSADQLLKLINDLLDLSRIESGRFELEAIKFNLLDELNDILNLVSLKLAESGNLIQVNFDSDLPETIETDPLRLRQVIVNLLGNAIKFTSNGSIDFSVSKEADSLCIDVTDSGMGIPEDKLDYIFGKFNQVDSSVSREHGGAGLGLAISKRLVEAMQGKITVTSTVGRGTTFRVKLPIKSEIPTTGSPEHTIEGRTERDGQEKNLNILLVEDDKTNQKIASAMLHKYGHTVSLADNGEQAVKRCQEENDFDVILMDIQMPIMDGITATRQLRDKGVDLPIIAMTANAMTGDRERYLEAGMSDYISKPIHMDELLNILQPYTMR